MILSIIEGVLFVVIWRAIAFYWIKALERAKRPEYTYRVAAIVAGLASFIPVSAINYFTNRNPIEMDWPVFAGFLVAMVLATAILGPVVPWREKAR